MLAASLVTSTAYDTNTACNHHTLHHNSRTDSATAVALCLQAVLAELTQWLLTAADERYCYIKLELIIGVFMHAHSFVDTALTQLRRRWV
jgi:hypothetical protein